MAFRAFALLLAASSLIAEAHGSGLHTSLFEKRQTCPTCALGGNPIAKLVKFFAFGEEQSTVDCRMESVFGLPADLGGEGTGGFEAAVRVNFDEDLLACSVEGVSLPIGNEIENTVCVAGGAERPCHLGACIVRPNIPVVENQALTDAECIPAQGAIRFARFHDTGDCTGTEIVTELTVGGRSTTGFSPNDGGGLFFGGVITRCSTLSTV
ncbi:hypothetical protein GQ44DRAFT_730335 [Phaeosphaeriaceae sp. PMI808]|nr:hypothetical protein GQ44DRAFT_730335 [Phaeosphaeriaceae sp. PMI808]